MRKGSNKESDSERSQSKLFAFMIEAGNVPENDQSIKENKTKAYLLSKGFKDLGAIEENQTLI